MTSPSSVSIGEILAGKYRVERVLGEGGMGVVLAATHVQLDQRVALKFLRTEVMGNAEVVARFSREARAAARIRSEHVARIYDVGELEDGAPYLVMEYLEGEDLAHRLASSGSLSVSFAVDCVLEASEAIAEAHAAGIVHRDLKPANLYLARRPDQSSIVKVLDFGISKALSGQDGVSTKTTAMLGSPFYMSPEQLTAARTVDVRADVWAMGVILYELVTGAPPFVAETLPEVVARILSSVPAPIVAKVPAVPPEFEAVVLRALEKDPAARFASVAHLAHALVPFGGERASAQAERISRVLQIDPTPLRSSSPSGRVSGQMLPIAPTTGSGALSASSRPESTAAAWSETNGTGATSGAKKGWIVAALAGATLLLIGGAYASFGGWSRETPTPPAVPIAAANGTAPETPSAPSLVPAPSAEGAQAGEPAPATALASAEPMATAEPPAAKPVASTKVPGPRRDKRPPEPSAAQATPPKDPSPAATARTNPLDFKLK